MTEGPASNVVSLASKREPSDEKAVAEVFALAAKETYSEVVIAGWVEGQLVWFHHGSTADINLLLDQVKADVLADLDDD